MGKFDGKVVIVTGSSSGIGRAALCAFAAKGASVVIHGQSVERLEEVQKTLAEAGTPASRMLVVRGSLEDDTTPATIINKTIEKFGRIDVLVNNAAAVGKKDLNKNDVQTLDFLYKVNLRSIIVLSELALPHLEKTSGNIVNVSTIATLKVLPGFEFYSTLKASINLYGKILAEKYASKGVRVNNVLPGWTKTNILCGYGIEGAKCDEMISENGRTNTLLKRVGEPEEIANMILFLAKNTSGFITGQEFVVDGGDSVNRFPREIDPTTNDC